MSDLKYVTIGQQPFVDEDDLLPSADSVATLTNKTLTTPVIPSIYQDAAKTKLMSLPDTASDTLAAIAATQTLTNKTLTSPGITSPNMTLGIATHSYGSAHADWTLSAAEAKATILKPTLADQAVNAIVPDTAWHLYIVVNTTGQALTVKTAAGTGIAVANTKVALVMSDGTNVIRISADA
jgi:hypothetical protein